MSRLLRITLCASLCAFLVAFAALVVSVPTTRAATPLVATSRAFLAGRLGYEGGPYPGGFHATAGSVEVAFSTHPLVLEKKVGKTGHFRIPLSPGTYIVTGCGPSSSAGSTPRCGRPKTVTLRAGEVRHIRLVWMYAP
jgi:hypothetical protein